MSREEEPRLDPRTVRTGIWLLDTAATLVRWYVRIIVGSVVILALMLAGFIAIGFISGILSPLGFHSTESLVEIPHSADAARPNQGSRAGSFARASSTGGVRHQAEPVTADAAKEAERRAPFEHDPADHDIQQDKLQSEAKAEEADRMTPQVRGLGKSAAPADPSAAPAADAAIVGLRSESEPASSPHADGYECRVGNASFDCLRAKTIVERTICTSESLAARDCLLGYVYRYSLRDAFSPEVRQRIAQDQRDWVRERNRFCEAKPAAELAGCLTQLINDRARDLMKTYRPESRGVFSEDDFR